MLHLLQMGPFKALDTLLFWIQNSRQLSPLELSFLLHPCFFWRFHTSNTVPSSLSSPSWYTSTVQPGPSGISSANTSPSNLLSPSAHFISPPSAPSPCPHVSGCFPIPPASFPLTCSGFFNGMLKIVEPGALN